MIKQDTSTKDKNKIQEKQGKISIENSNPESINLLKNKNDMITSQGDKLQFQNQKVIASTQEISKKENTLPGTTQKLQGKNDNSTEEKQEKVERFNRLSNQENIGIDVSFWKNRKTIASAAVISGGILYYATGCNIL